MVQLAWKYHIKKTACCCFAVHSASFLLLLLGTEFFPLFVCAKYPVPPSECAGIVPIEVVMMKVMKPSTCDGQSDIVIIHQDRHMIIIVFICTIVLA